MAWTDVFFCLVFFINLVYQCNMNEVCEVYHI